MKKLFTIIVILCFCLGKSEAQTNATFKSGLSISNTFLANEYGIYNSIPKVTPFVGMDFLIPISKKWSGNLGVQLIQKGHHSIFLSDCGNSPTFFGKVIYFDVMPNIHYHFNDFYSIFTGVNVGIKAKERYSVKDWNETKDVRTDFNFDAINTVDIGGMIGVRFKYKSLYFDLSSNRSINSTLKNSFKEQNSLFLGKTTYKNQTIQIGLGYII
jgi:hypothetical protein